MTEIKDRPTSAVAGFSLLALTLAIAEPILAQSSVEGAWMLTRVENVDGNINDDPLPGLWIFTSDHYSFMFEVGPKPREVWGDEDPSEAQVIEAFWSIRGQSGRYQVEGDELIARPYVAMLADLSAGWPDNPIRYPFTRDDDTLTFDLNGIKLIFQYVERAEYP